HALLGACALILFARAEAQTALLNEVHSVASPTQAVPVEHSFDVSLQGTYEVTLVDLGAAFIPPAPLKSAKLAVISGNTVVATLTAPGSTQFDATPGTYSVQVIGAPGTDPGSGPIGVQIVNKADNSTLRSFSDTLALPSTALPSNLATIDDTFTVG